MRGRKKQIRTPNGGRHPTSDFRGRRRAEKSERSREEHTHPSHFASKHISTARIRAQMCLCIFAFGSLREGYTFFLVRALFFPLSLRIVLPRLRKLSLLSRGRKKNKKIAKLCAPLLEEPNMVRAFALVEVEHKKLMVLL